MESHKRPCNSRGAISFPSHNLKYNFEIFSQASVAKVVVVLTEKRIKEVLLVSLVSLVS